MPKLTTSNGVVLKFKTVPLYSGSSVINPKNSKENLFLFKDIMDEHNIFFALTAGTALGAIREKRFIEHDEDIDLALFNEDKQRVIDILPELYYVGFKVVRYNRRHVISIMRNNDYIDLYFFEKINEKEYDCDGCMILAEFMENTRSYSFLGRDFMMPLNVEGYLACEYGDNWRIPRHYFDFHQPFWKTNIKKAKEILKDLLPDAIFIYLSEKSASKQRAYYRGLFNKYHNK